MGWERPTYREADASRGRRPGDVALRPARSRRPRRRRWPGPRGFGLLEVVVALFVLGVALTGIVRSLGFGVGVAGAAHRSMLARQLAVDAAVSLPVDPAEALAVAAAGGPERVDVDDASFPCTRSLAGWQEGGRTWVWIEVECELEGAAGDGAPAWRPGRASLLVAR